jgi:hypothetical protein
MRAIFYYKCKDANISPSKSLWKIFKMAYKLSKTNGQTDVEPKKKII